MSSHILLTLADNSVPYKIRCSLANHLPEKAEKMLREVNNLHY